MTAAVIPYRTIAVETIRQAGFVIAVLVGLWVTLSGITRMPAMLEKHVNQINAVIAQNAVTNSRIDDTNRKLETLICLNAQLKPVKVCLAEGSR